MSDVKRLVYSIIQFLTDQLSSGNLSPDAAESLEVAIQCLEQAYSINHEEIAGRSCSEVAQSLLDMFIVATRNQQQFQAVSQEISTEAKGEAERLKNRGNELMKVEKFTEALECYCKAIKLDSSNAIYYCNRAAAYSKINNHQEAIADCDKAILIDPNYSKAFGRKGLAHASLGQHREAKECYEKATQLDPENESYLSNLKVAEEKLRETNLGSQASGTSSQPNPGLFGMENAGLNFSYLLNNPTLMSMATQMMADPNMQQMGQQLAAQMEASNPDLVNQLRRQMQTDGNRNENEEDNSPK